MSKYALINEIPVMRAECLRKNQTNLPTFYKEVAISDNYDALEQFKKENNLLHCIIIER